jgi:TonB family protein
MRVAIGLGLVTMLAACAEQTPEQRAPAPRAAAQETSAVDPSAITPERQDAVERLFVRKAGELQACWTEEYERSHNRKLEGDLTVQLMVDSAGKPGDVKILKSTLGNQDVENCVIKAISAWAFPEGRASMPYNRTVHLGAQF